MTDTSIGGSLSPEENAFFESGGESAFPSDTGADTPAGDSGVTSSEPASSGGDKSAEPDKPADKSKDYERVPIAELQKERAKRHEVDRQFRELQQQFAELNGKFSMVNKPAGEQPADGPPKAEDDIFGAFNALKKQVDDDVKAKADAAKAQTDQQTFVRTYQADATRFEKETPDFKDAYQFLLKARAQQIALLPQYRNNLEAQHNALVSDEYNLAQSALQAGESPAALFYSLAKEFGYKKAAEPGKGAEKLETIERGQAANKSLSNTGSVPGDNDMTIDRLLAMDQEDFAAYEAKNPSKVRRIMGG